MKDAYSARVLFLCFFVFVVGSGDSQKAECCGKTSVDAGVLSSRGPKRLTNTWPYLE